MVVVAVWLLLIFEVEEGVSWEGTSGKSPAIATATWLWGVCFCRVFCCSVTDYNTDYRHYFLLSTFYWFMPCALGLSACSLFCFGFQLVLFSQTQIVEFLLITHTVEVGRVSVPLTVLAFCSRVVYIYFANNSQQVKSSFYTSNLNLW